MQPALPAFPETLEPASHPLIDWQSMGPLTLAQNRTTNGPTETSPNAEHGLLVIQCILQRIGPQKGKVDTLIVLHQMWDRWDLGSNKSHQPLESRT